MAGWLGIPVVVEGVETKEQRDFLESIGCTYVQGYYFARPMPVEAYEKVIEEEADLLTSRGQSTEDLLDNFDTLFSSDSSTGTLLKSVSVPYAIIEYGNSHVDLLRTNQSFTEAFEGNPLEHYLIQKENYKLIEALDEAVLSGRKSECECMFIMRDGKSKWYHIHLLHIGTIGTTSLISATFTDVTTERRLEKELHSVFLALKDAENRKSSLLVIDDQEMSREIITTLFEDDYEVLQAEDGLEGLQILKEKSDQIAVILLDMLMPNMDGREFLSYKNKMQEAMDIPIVVISSEADEALQIHMLENGVNDYVIKPFVPAVMKKRLNNVLEYNSRFRTLVREYHEANAAFMPENGRINLTGYSAERVKEMIRFMNQIFDLVRLVDPVETAVITIEDDNTVTRVPYSCFSIWGKNVRCENCSSLCALNGHCSLNKFELLKNDVFYVVSQPVEVHLADGISSELVLEVASRISDETGTSPEEPGVLFDTLQSVNDLIYRDPLTGAYNRRFFDEMLFLHHGQNTVAKKVALILMDLFRFKQINDLFGHQTGDQVLKDVVASLQKQIRQNDSIIRFGGDEFVVFLTNCEKNQIKPAIERFKTAVQDVHYGPNQTIYADADFGYAYTEAFKQTDEMLSDMIKEADEVMYRNKRHHNEENQ